MQTQEDHYIPFKKIPIVVTAADWVEWAANVRVPPISHRFLNFIRRNPYLIDDGHFTPREIDRLAQVHDHKEGDRR